MKKRIRSVFVISAAALLSMSTVTVSFAASWEQDENGRWVDKDEPDSDGALAGPGWVDKDKSDSSSALGDVPDGVENVGNKSDSDGALAGPGWVEKDKSDSRSALGDVPDGVENVGINKLLRLFNEQKESTFNDLMKSLMYNGTGSAENSDEFSRPLANDESWVLNEDENGSSTTKGQGEYVYDEIGDFYYNENGHIIKNWMSMNNTWYYMDSQGKKTVNTLIEYNNDKYFFDDRGAMVTDQWVGIDKENADPQDGSDKNWYYFQEDGTAITNGNSSRVEPKEINGKRYGFDNDGKMLVGWVAADNPEPIDNTDGDAYMTGDYYFDKEDGGAMAVGWRELDITDDSAEDDYTLAPVFNGDTAQTRYFYFKSNGKKIKASDSAGEDGIKEKSINGMHYGFDSNGRMVAEWSLDVDKAIIKGATAANGTYEGTVDFWQDDEPIKIKTVNSAKYSGSWKWFGTVDEGARLSNGWFKVTPTEYLDPDKAYDDEAGWYYADKNGHIYAGEIKSINGKRYAFNENGRMLTGGHFIRTDPDHQNVIEHIIDEDDDDYNFDEEDSFLRNGTILQLNGYRYYNFGGEDDGVMKTGRHKIQVGGETFIFYFNEQGGKRGTGYCGIKQKKIYQNGMLLTAGEDELHQIVVKDKDNDTYIKCEDTFDFIDNFVSSDYGLYQDSSIDQDLLKQANLKGKPEDYTSIIILRDNFYKKYDAFVINRTGMVKEKGAGKNGNDVYLGVTGGRLKVIYEKK